MNLPGEQQWQRVEQLEMELRGLSPEKAASRISSLAAEGESTIVLSLLGTWLALPAPPPPVECGNIVGGRYTLLAQLGEGGMGSVWRARQELIGRDVALKIIHPAMVTPSLQARFVSEMELLGRLEHPGIVRIYDAGMSERPQGKPIPFFVMELVEGQPADVWAAERRNDRGALLRMVAGICAAMQSAHELQIIHRDLKPSNILVRPNGLPVVVDFGIARLTSIALGEELGVFSGTPQYAAPEQHEGRDQDFRSGESVDVYAIGAILFEALSGRRLFEFPHGASLSEMRMTVLKGPVVRLADVLPDCPRVLDELVTRAVRRDPSDRFYTVASLGKAIVRAAEALCPAPTPREPWKPAARAQVPGTQWRLMAKIGQGGAGEVWTGTHDKLGLRHVFKFCDTEEKARTLRRELTLFRLLKERVGRNPHFVQLQEVSLDEPPWYLMMDALDAQDLAAWWPGAVPENAREELALEIVSQTAEALQAAHEAGILHRDIKPANLLIQAPDQSQGVHVFVSDFGVGQLVAEELLRTGQPAGFTRTVFDLQANRLSGTLLYLAPELLEGNAATARSDIYSLGVILWQLLVGNLHAALDPAGWHQRIDDPLLREDLARCLAGRPEKRWSSAGELAQSLRSLPERRAAAFKRQEELSARERAAYRRGVFGVAGVAAALVVLFACLAWLAWTKSKESEIRRKEIALARTQNALDELKTLVELKSGKALKQLAAQAPTLNIREARLESDFREITAQVLALPVFDKLESAPFSISHSARFSEDGARLIRADAAGAEVIDLSGDSPAVHRLAGLAVAPSFMGLNNSGMAAGAIGPDGNLDLWYGRDLSERTQVSGPFHSGCFAFSPFPLTQTRLTAVAAARLDGSVDVSLLGANSSIKLLRRSSPTDNEFPESCPASMLAFSPVEEGALAVAGPQSDILLFWKIQDQQGPKLTADLAGSAWHPDTITCLAWSPLAGEIVTGCRDGVLRVWRFSLTGSVPQNVPYRSIDLGGPARKAAWSLDGGLVAVLLDSGEIRVLQAESLDQRPVATAEAQGADCLAFVSGGALMAWGTNVTSAWGSGHPLYFAERRIAPTLLSVDFHPDGCLMATTPDRVEFLNPSTLAWTVGFQNVSRYAAFLAGTNLIFDSNDQWNRGSIAKSGQTLKLSPVILSSLPESLCLASPEGRRVAWMDAHGLHAGSSLDKEEGRPVPLETQPALVAVSDASSFAAWSEGKVLSIHDYASGKTGTAELRETALGLAFSPEPDLLACRTEQAVVFVNPVSLKQVSADLPSGSLVAPIAFSPDGRWVAAIGRENSLVIAAVPPGPGRWQDGGAALQRAFSNPIFLRAPSRRRIVSLHWNPNGSRLACGTADGFVQSWDVSLLRKQLRLWNMDWGTDDPPKDVGFVPIRID